MRLIPFAAASIAVTAVIFVKADEDTQIDQTVLDYYFGGDEGKINYHSH
jgi:hypothetical protein